MPRALRNTALAALTLLLVAAALRLVGGAGGDGSPHALERESAEAQPRRAADAGSLAAADAAEAGDARTVLDERDGHALQFATKSSVADLRVTVVGAEVGPSSGPIEGATVELLVDDAVVVSAVTDAEGVCTLPNDPGAENVVVRAEAVGRYAARREVSPVESNVRLVLPGTAQLTFVVVDSETKAPLRDAFVALWTDEVELMAAIDRTDERGRTVSQGVPADSACFLMIRCDGYAFHGEQLRPPLEGGSREHRVELTVAADLRVRVFDRVSGRPIRLASVKSAWGHVRNSMSESADPDHEGLAVLSGCVPITVPPTEQASDAVVRVNAFGYCGVRLRVDLDSLGDDRVVDVPLVRSNTIDVNAMSSEGSPLEGRTVRVVYRAIEGDDGPTPIDPNAYDWPDGHEWIAGDRVHDYPLELGPDGGATIHGLPPGFVGLEIRTDDDERRLLAEVGSFAGTGETREVYVSLD